MEETAQNRITPPAAQPLAPSTKAPRKRKPAAAPAAPVADATPEPKAPRKRKTVLVSAVGMSAGNAIALAAEQPLAISTRGTGSPEVYVGLDFSTGATPATKEAITQAFAVPPVIPGTAVVVSMQEYINTDMPAREAREAYRALHESQGHLPNGGQVAPCEHVSGECQYKLANSVLPCSSCAGVVAKELGAPAVGNNQLAAAAAGATNATEAAAVVADLKELQLAQPRMVAIVNQGGLGRKLALYLQERGVAAVALVGEAPAHLAAGIHKLSPAQLAALAPEIPQGQALLEATRQELAKAGIRAALQTIPGQLRSHPAQIKHDAKQARKKLAKQQQLERTQAGQRRALAALTKERDLQAISLAYAEAGLVLPVATPATVRATGPATASIGGKLLPVATLTTGVNE